MEVYQKDNGAVHISLDSSWLDKMIEVEASKEGLTADEYLDKYYPSSSDSLEEYYPKDE